MYLLWLTVGKPSFLRNVVEKIKYGCRNLQRSLTMVNLSEIFLVEMLQKQRLSETSKLKSILVCWFENMSWSRIYSVDMGQGNCYWLNVAKHGVTE